MKTIQKIHIELLKRTIQRIMVIFHGKLSLFSATYAFLLQGLKLNIFLLYAAGANTKKYRINQ